MEQLRLVIRTNAAYCLGFGAAFVVWPSDIGAFLGSFPETWMRLMGAALVLNGAHLALASLRERLLPREIQYFTIGDIAWFVASVGVIGANLLITNGIAQVVTAGVAAGVLALGLAQIWLLAEAQGAGVPSAGQPPASGDDLLPRELGRAGAIVLSWRSMKSWIKTWLFALNGLFLAAVVFLPDPSARLILAAYIASGPLLAGIAIWQRGLTRLLGLAHLIPWLPLVLSLTDGLVSGKSDSSASAPLTISYAILMLAAVTACLLLDAADVARWLRGEKYRLGSANAARLGGSMGCRS